MKRGMLYFHSSKLTGTHDTPSITVLACLSRGATSTNTGSSYWLVCRGATPTNTGSSYLPRSFEVSIGGNSESHCHLSCPNYYRSNTLILCYSVRQEQRLGFHNQVVLSHLFCPAMCILEKVVCWREENKLLMQKLYLQRKVLCLLL